MRNLKKTIILKVDKENPDEKAISQAAKIIREGALVAFPTETVYGLAANLLDETAIDSLYKVKSRPRNKPFTVHIADVKTIKELGCVVTIQAKKLIDKFWPGPLTIILKSHDGKSIGFRMPQNKIALDLIRKANVPVAAPSANLSSRQAPTSAEEVLRDLDGKIDLVIDSGPTDVGVESTVVDLTGTSPKVLREGAIKKEELGL